MQKLDSRFRENDGHFFARSHPYLSAYAPIGGAEEKPRRPGDHDRGLNARWYQSMSRIASNEDFIFMPKTSSVQLCNTIIIVLLSYIYCLAVLDCIIVYYHSSFSDVGNYFAIL